MAHPITWFEILGQDTAKLRGFYGELFGWKAVLPPGDTFGYAEISPDQAGIGGGIGKTQDAAGKGWVTVYVRVPDLQAAIAHAERLGGKLVRPIMNLPDLSFAVIADPEGHAVGLITK